MTYDLDDKVVIVTGAARGIGYECARLFSDHGAMVIAIDLNPSVKDLTSMKILEPIVMDVSDEDQVKEYIDDISRRYGRIDILVNNAGITMNKSLTETRSEDWDKVLNTNAKGYFLNTRAVLPIMQKQTSGVITNVSSIVGSVGMELTTAYAASKGAINQLTRVTAIENGTFGIRANAVAPGVVETDILEGIVPNSKETLASYGDSHLLGRVARPSEIAEVIVYLSSPKASTITGAIIAADGGYTTG